MPRPTDKIPAVVLLSGGLDSTTVLALVAANPRYAPHALTIDYGQRHARELRAASDVARRIGAPQTLLEFDLTRIGGSALTDDTIEVPKNGPSAGIPPTYVPARNTILLAVALGFAESIGADEIFLGVSSVDYSGYPDCRPAYIDAFERLANLATKRAIEGERLMIHAPLLYLTKRETVELGWKHDAPYALSWSCYDPRGQLACGRCDSCRLRRRAFDAAAGRDPIRYAA